MEEITKRSWDCRIVEPVTWLRWYRPPDD